MKTVFFGAAGSIVRWAYKDVYENPQIEYCEFDKKTVQSGKISDSLFFSAKGNFLPFFLKDKIYKRALKYKFLKEKESALFVFVCQYGLFNENGFFTFVNYLKKKYKKSKFVFYYNDIIATCEPEKFGKVKKIFDLILTFDKAEAKNYGMTYYGIVHSKAQPALNEIAEDSDVFYVGSDRGRFNDILKTFIVLSDAGKRCIFYLFDLLKENESKLYEFLNKCEKEGKTYKYKNSLFYVNEYCWYGKTLSYISKTKCLVEILLPTQTAGTLRLAESIMYGKKLITNCKAVKEKPYYREENIFVFDKPEDIDVKFLDTPCVAIDYDFSPLKMIEYAKKMLIG